MLEAILIVVCGLAVGALMIRAGYAARPHLFEDAMGRIDGAACDAAFERELEACGGIAEHSALGWFEAGWKARGRQ